MLLFPNRDGGLDRVDDLLTGCEGGFPVSCTDCDANSNVADLEVPGAVDAASRDEIMLEAYFLHDAKSFLLCEGWECFILEGCHIISLVVVPDPSFKRREASCAGIAHFITEGLWINGGIAEVKHILK